MKEENSTSGPRKLSGFLQGTRGRMEEVGERSRRRTAEGKMEETLREEKPRRSSRKISESKGDGDKAYTSITILEVRNNDE